MGAFGVVGLCPVLTGAVPSEGLLLTQLLRAGMMSLMHYSMPVALLCFISQLKHGAL